jgi:hypothetical protein
MTIDKDSQQMAKPLSAVFKDLAERPIRPDFSTLLKSIDTTAVTRTIFKDLAERPIGPDFSTLLKNIETARAIFENGLELDFDLYSESAVDIEDLGASTIAAASTRFVDIACLVVPWIVGVVVFVCAMHWYVSGLRQEGIDPAKQDSIHLRMELFALLSAAVAAGKAAKALIDRVFPPESP